MVDAQNIINFYRTDEELEELILFLVCVAGKTAKTICRQLEAFLGGNPPFALIRETKDLEGALRASKLGQYTKLVKSFRQLSTSGLNLRTCTLDDLLKIHGVGRKSASCFLCWTRPDAKHAMLDTHILKFLKACGVSNVPKSTPTAKEYDRLEKEYLKIAENLGQNPTFLDFEIWKYYSNKLDKLVIDGKIIL